MNTTLYSGALTSEQLNLKEKEWLGNPFLGCTAVLFVWPILQRAPFKTSYFPL